MKPKTPSGKPPKWVIPTAVIGLVALVYIMRRKKPATTGNATEPGTQGLSNQSFIPVTGENVAGMGTPFGAGGSENQSFITNFLKEQQQEMGVRRTEEKQESREAKETERDFYERLIANLGTGGGAPSTGGSPGTTVVPPPDPIPVTPPPVSPPPTPAPTPHLTCPSSFPLWNPANGAPAPHSCWKYSRDRCANKAYPYKHVYQDGHIVCSPT